MNPNLNNFPSSEWPNMRLDEKLEFEKLKVMLQNDKTTNATSSSEFLMEIEQETKIII